MENRLGWDGLQRTLRVTDERIAVRVALIWGGLGNGRLKSNSYFRLDKVWHNSGMSKTLIRQMTQVITRQFKPERVILFGSQARGAGTKHSDIDFLVVLANVSNKRESAIQIRRALAKFPVAKDIIVTTPEEIKRRGNLVGSVLRSALQEGKVVYERG